MTSKTITDRAGDTLRLSTGSLTAGPGEITIKVTERFRGRETVAAVHVDPAALRAALDGVAPLGKYTRTTPDPDDMDGGVAAALIEKEAEESAPSVNYHAMWWNAEREREKAERERDEARAAMSELAPAEVCVRGDWFKPSELPEVLGRVMDARDEARREAKRYYLRAAAPRPLTPDAITEAQQDRARDAVLALLAEQEPRPLFATVKAGKIARAAIRAALAEPPARPEGAEHIDEHLRQANAAALGGALTPEQRRALADHLAGFGYRNPLDRAEDGAA